MTFKIIDKKTGKEPTGRVIDNIARKHNLMVCDIDQFYIGEDGNIVLADDCGRVAYVDMKRFSVEVEQEPILDKIRAEIDDATEIHSDGEFYIKNIDVKRIIDKYKAESEE